MANKTRPYKGITPTLGERVYIDPAATVIGDVTLGDDVSVWPGAVIRGDTHHIRVGHRSNVQDNAVLHCTHDSHFNPGGFPLDIGDDVIIGHGAILHGCTLKGLTLVGNGAIVNDGAIVEEEVIIGSGCVVPPGKVLESGYLYVGAPAKQARALTDKEKQFFSYSPMNYIKLKDQYLSEM